MQFGGRKVGKIARVKKVQTKKTGSHLLSRTIVRAHALVFAPNGCASRALTFDNVSSQRRFSIVCAQDSYICICERVPKKEREKRGKAMQLTYVERDYAIFFLHTFFFFFFLSERIENDAKMTGANDTLRGRRKIWQDVAPLSIILFRKYFDISEYIEK